MRFSASIQAAAIGLCLTFIASGEARAASFSFTKIADTSGAFSSFVYSPALNNGGTVAFIAGLDAGGTAIFTGNGRTTTAIADSDGPFSSFTAPLSINDAGTVAFSADLNAGGSGIFTSNGITTTTIAIRTAFSGSVDYPSINNTGTVAYKCATSGVGNFYGYGVGITTSNGMPVDQGEGGRCSDRRIIYTPPSINDAGTVAFSVYPPPVIVIGNSGFLAPEAALATVSFNNAETVAFTSGTSIFTTNGTTTTTVADINGPFGGFFSPPSINDAGTVAFLASLDVGGKGIFTGPNSLNDKVITTGDPLFGSTVTSLSFYQEGLNNAGQVAFLATLADGTSGIFRADPSAEPPKSVPEPASTSELLAFGAFSMVSLLKRKQKKSINSAS